MRALLLTRARQYLKARLKQTRRSYIKSFHAFSAVDLARGIAALGIGAGDTLLVHSSFDAFLGFTGRPTDVIAVLQSAVGANGAVLMPTLPFGGTAVEYARRQLVFDVMRTPSRMGLLTELFRRSAGVVRSVHPTHPVAAWGRDAVALVEGHHMAHTPCGNGSPYARLRERRGKILLMGTGIGVLTFFHTIEEVLEQKLPASPFTDEVFHLQSRDNSGNIVATHTRLFEPGVSRRRNLDKLVPELRRRGAWRERRTGCLQLIGLDAEDVFETVSAMAETGTYCYD